jgi:hypothetical protein
MDDSTHDDDSTDICEGCGDDLDGAGNYTELEFPTDEDDGIGYVSGKLCDGCASLSADVVSDHAGPTGIQNLYDELGVDTPSTTDTPTGTRADGGGEGDGADDGSDEDEDSEPSVDGTREALEAALDAIDALQEQLGKPPREMDMSAVRETLEAVDIDSDAIDASVRSAVTRARQRLEHVDTAAGDEVGVIGTHALAELAPVAARAAREWRDDLPHPGAASIDEDTTDVDIDLDGADDPLLAFQEAMYEADAPPWTLRVLVEVDRETAQRYQPLFEQALDDPRTDLYDLLYNYGHTDLDVTIDGYDPEYYFRTRARKEERRNNRRQRGP